MREMKLDASVRFELHAVPCKVVLNEAIADRAPVRGCARHQNRAARKEDQPSFWAQEPVDLGEPSVRAAPHARSVLGDRQVEALAVEGDVFGVRRHQREPGAELVLERLRGSKLSLRKVDRDGAESPSRKPGRDGGGAAPELNGVLARVESVQEAELGLRCAPESPEQLVRLPRFPSGCDAGRRPPLPGGPVAVDVVELLLGGWFEELGRDRAPMRAVPELAHLGWLVQPRHGIAYASVISKTHGGRDAGSGAREGIRRGL